MKILFLYNNACAAELCEWLKEQGNDVTACQTRLDKEWCEKQRFDLTVSYTYRYILPAEILHALGDNAVNLHNSFLPWNRGADPNIWSIAEGTPRGVTLHYMSAGLDKGDIIAQALVGEGEKETLKSTYYALDAAAKRLFQEAFRYYAFWPQMKKQAMGGGSYHSARDGENIRACIDTYDLPIREFRSRLQARGQDRI